MAKLIKDLIPEEWKSGSSEPKMPRHSSTISLTTTTDPCHNLRKKSDLLYVYPPEKQREMCSYIQDCIDGDYPTLALVGAKFSRKVVVAWLVQHLFNLSEFCGCKEKLSNDMMDELGFIIMNEFYYLKMTELMLFFYRFKLGEYGKFYGSVDPMVILSSLRQFVTWRNVQIDRYGNERKQQQMEEWRKTAISREEYEKRLKNEKHKDQGVAGQTGGSV